MTIAEAEKDAGQELKRLNLPPQIHSAIYSTLMDHNQNARRVGHVGVDNPWDMLGIIHEYFEDLPSIVRWEFGINDKTHPLKLTECPIEAMGDFADLARLYVDSAAAGFLQPIDSVNPGAIAGMLTSAWGGNQSGDFDAGIFLSIGTLVNLTKNGTIEKMWHGYHLETKTYVLCMKAESAFWIWAIVLTDILPLSSLNVPQ